MRLWMCSYFKNQTLQTLVLLNPSNSCSDGQAADADMRRHLSQEGIRRLTEVRLDDIFLYTDSDEIPRTEYLTFLKLYDGLPHLVSMAYIWSIYGFYCVHGQSKGYEKAA